MTYFEELAKELKVKITTDENGFYTGMCKGLAVVVNEVILSDNEEIFNMSQEAQRELIKENFYKTFPYMK